MVDYASPVWSPTATAKVIKMLELTQKTAAQVITGAFRSVALSIAEVEASIEPIKVRLLEQAARHWVNLHTLPDNHPFWRLRRKINLKNTRFPSPLQLTAMALRELDVSNIERISPFCIAPWFPRAVVLIEDRDKAIKTANRPLQPYERAIFVDGSARNGMLGIGIASSHIIKGVSHRVVDISKTIGRSEALNTYYSELTAILEAAKQIANNVAPPPVHFVREVSIYSNSQAALKALENPKQQSRQSLIYETLKYIHNLIV